MKPAGHTLLERYPVLGVCGCSGAGKTTLIEALLPRLQSIGLRVAVVKHDAHNLSVDTPGKDSDRFFRAGADVFLFGEECFSRRQSRGDFTSFLVNLCTGYDLVLVEGHAKTEIPKIWLLGPGHVDAPSDNQGLLLKILSREQAAVDDVFSFVHHWLSRICRQTPVWGCVLIGGRSRRMGRPKHLIERAGKTWLEHAVAKLDSRVEKVVLSGRGVVPDSLAGLDHLPDVPGLAGPLAGVLAAMRWQPEVSWLVLACDLPDVQVEALQWLLDGRCPGIHAILPDLKGDGCLEPLLAWYDFRCRPLLEEIAASGSLRISRLAGQENIRHFQPPARLQDSWRNVNTPAELTQT